MNFCFNLKAHCLQAPKHFFLFKIQKTRARWDVCGVQQLVAGGASIRELERKILPFWRLKTMKQTHLSVAPVTMPKPSSGTILGHLTVLGITIADIAQCLSLEDEWAFIKKHHFNHIKVCHPDKGGDAETFRAVNDSFNVLRELVSKKQVKRFASESAAHAPVSRSSAQAEHAPWAWYEESSKVDFVPYIVSCFPPPPSLPRLKLSCPR